MPLSAAKLLIGIDPDCDKSGVAVYDKSSKSIELFNYTFFELFEFLKTAHSVEMIKEVRVEASWLIKKANWHAENKGVGVAAQIGLRTGANHETGRKIIEMCQHLGIPYLEIRPIKKIWKGPDGKITHEELSRIINLPKQTNQEVRDASLLVL